MIPDRSSLIESLEQFIDQQQIQPDPQFSHWNSGVYAVLDCVFSALAKYDTVVLPTLKRFGENTGLVDEPGLTFSAFLQDVERFPEEDRFKTYASDMMKNSQVLSGRTKVEVAYEVCKVFKRHGYNTKADLLALPKGKPADPEAGTPVTLGVAEQLVLEGIVNGIPPEDKVRGIGAALGPYLLMSLGFEDYVKPDTLLLRLMGRIGGWQPRAGHPGDVALIQDVITQVARSKGTTPARLDNALWRYESDLASFYDSEPLPTQLPAKRSTDPAFPLTARFSQALQLAHQWHLGQFRKVPAGQTPTLPYISHLLGVASVALEFGADEDEAIAALLHDALEDGPKNLTPELDQRAAVQEHLENEIERKFGVVVAKLVKGATEETPLVDGKKAPWAERKAQYLQKLDHESASSLLVSASDKLHNARTILSDLLTAGGGLEERAQCFERFNQGRDGTLQYYRLLADAYKRAQGPGVSERPRLQALFIGFWQVVADKVDPRSSGSRAGGLNFRPPAARRPSSFAVRF
ncbi:hypothetical protein GCM10022631_25620 [Deinococcus rubellus]|uniref:HD domain-containing protein n=1 Tax=Deinococcus rubellus TaxID=1889240 RepID=UPI0031E67347